jgi:hypothetical protein
MLPSIGCGWPLDRLLLVILNKQVAFDLGINEKTIKVHRGRVMSAQSLADLVRMAEMLDIHFIIAVPSPLDQGPIAFSLNSCRIHFQHT